MVKRAGNGKPRTPTKKEKLQRILEAQESEKLAKKYIYPIGIGGIVLFFIVLYGYLYSKS